FNIVGCPIRISADQSVCARTRSFSQLITSFFASESLGIPHTPLFCLLCSTFLVYSFSIQLSARKPITLNRKLLTKKCALYYYIHPLKQVSIQNIFLLFKCISICQ